MLTTTDHLTAAADAAVFSGARADLVRTLCQLLRAEPRRLLSRRGIGWLAHALLGRHIVGYLNSGSGRRCCR
jgi:hypothetical protein